MPFAKSARNVEPGEGLAELDACGARHQHPGFAFDFSAGRHRSAYDAWRNGRFTLLASVEQLDELRAVLRKPGVARFVKPRKAGRLINQLRRFGEDTGRRGCDGTFGEVLPGEIPIKDPGYLVARGGDSRIVG